MSNREFFRSRWAGEVDMFCKVFEAVNEERADWAPDPKSRSARRLIGHIVGHVQDLNELMDDSVIHHRNEVSFDSIGDAVRTFREESARLDGKVAALSEEDWQRPSRFLVGEREIMAMPLADTAWLLLFDSVHHRGQLTTHLRAIGGRCPSLYGPSADEAMAQ